MERLREEAGRMKQLLGSATDDTLPDRATLANTIMAWEQTIKALLDQKKAFTVRPQMLSVINHNTIVIVCKPYESLQVKRKTNAMSSYLGEQAKCHFLKEKFTPKVSC